MSNESFSGLEQDALQSALLEKATELVQTIESGDLQASVEMINALHNARHEVFYREVGVLTRGLHEAIKAFGEDVSDRLNLDETAKAVMHDASDRLGHVIELTEKTSHETMDRVDRSLVLVDNLDDQSERFKGLLSLVGQLEDEFESLKGVFDQTCELRDSSETTVSELRSLLTDIVVSQSVQDITGQLIRRVITLLTQVEGQLVKLIGMAAKVEQLGGIESRLGTGSSKSDDLPATNNDQDAEPEAKKSTEEVKAVGPQINKNAPDIARNQDDVDDLLSSLGF